MKKINRCLSILLLFGILLPILFVVGILFVVLFASKNPPLMVAGIIFIVFGFYGTPLIWTNYGAKKSNKRLLQLILNENIYSIQELSEQTGTQEKQTLALVRGLINGGYLTGYLIVDEKYLKLNQNVKQEKSRSFVKCPYCGAKTIVNGPQSLCEYCGSLIDNNHL